ncbi:hypothetical protein PUN28_011022 [Cardiocondyla obscurior]|uniref:Uncharacterized protein n=1 Tax=Cardiocondyla obscurior TaxID=286306 RepID=A0AAW2FM59_9HYME
MCVQKKAITSAEAGQFVRSGLTSATVRSEKKKKKKIKPKRKQFQFRVTGRSNEGTRARNKIIRGIDLRGNCLRRPNATHVERDVAVPKLTATNPVPGNALIN